MQRLVYRNVLPHVLPHQLQSQGDFTFYSNQIFLAVAIWRGFAFGQFDSSWL